MDQELEIYSNVTFKILKNVKENPNIKSTDLKQKLPRSNYLHQKYIPFLVKNELITETRHGLHNIKTYKITKKGEKIHQTLEQVEHIMNEADELENFIEESLKANSNIME